MLNFVCEILILVDNVSIGTSMSMRMKMKDVMRFSSLCVIVCVVSLQFST